MSFKTTRIAGKMAVAVIAAALADGAWAQASGAAGTTGGGTADTSSAGNTNGGGLPQVQTQGDVCTRRAASASTNRMRCSANRRTGRCRCALPVRRRIICRTCMCASSRRRAAQKC